MKKAKTQADNTDEYNQHQQLEKETWVENVMGVLFASLLVD